MSIKTNAQIAYDIIKGNILECRYKPGQLLSEKEIVEELNMSRTPVREALNILDGQQALKIIYNKGIQISPISIKNMREIYELRKILEIISIREALKNIKPKDMEALDEIYEQYRQLSNDVKSQDLDRLFEAGKDIHLFIAKLSNNETLYSILKNLREESYRGYVYFLSRNLESYLPGERNKTREKIAKGHRELVKAIKNRDEELAIQLVMEDLATLMDLIFAY